LEVNLPIASLMRSESLSHVIESLCDALRQKHEVSTDDTAEHSAASAPARLSELTESQAAALLEQLPNLGAEEVSQLLNQMLGERS